MRLMPTPGGLSLQYEALCIRIPTDYISRWPLDGLSMASRRKWRIAYSYSTFCADSYLGTKYLYAYNMHANCQFVYVILTFSFLSMEASRRHREPAMFGGRIMPSAYADTRGSVSVLQDVLRI